MNKILSVFLALFILSAFAGAVTISAPASVPENVAWGFSVDLQGSSDVVVKVDDALLVEVKSDGTVTRGKFNNGFVSTPGSSIVYVSHFGLGSGSHTITADSSSGNASAAVSAFKPLDNSFSDQLSTEVNQKVDAKLESVDQTFKNIEADNKEFFRRINATDEKVSSIDSTIGSISNRLDAMGALDAKLSTVDDRLEVLETIREEEEAARLAREEELKNSPITGFVTLASDFAIPLALIVIVVVIGLVAFLAKDQILGLGSSIYSKRDENNLPISDKDMDAMGKALEAEGGKWSLKSKKNQE
ncbi:MAG TPA: hypothetical protein VFF13_03620 [archaeon]|nr:hypothetical protein [archaeon]